MARDFIGSGDSWLAASSAPVSGVPYSMSILTDLDVNNVQQVALGMFHATDGNPISSIRYTSAGKPDAAWRGNNAAHSSGATGTTTVSTGVKQSLVGTFDSSAIARVYHNGSLEATGGTPAGTAITLQNILVGVRLNNGAPQDRLNGRGCEAAIWNRVLETWEIAALGKFFSPLWFKRGLVWHRDLIRELNRPKIGPDVSITGTVDVAVHFPQVIYPRRWGVPLTSAATSDGAGTAAGAGAAAGVGASIAAALGFAEGTGAALGIAPGTGSIAASQLNPTLN